MLPATPANLAAGALRILLLHQQIALDDRGHCGEAIGAAGGELGEHRVRLVELVLLDVAQGRVILLALLARGGNALMLPEQETGKGNEPGHDGTDDQAPIFLPDAEHLPNGDIPRRLRAGRLRLWCRRGEAPKSTPCVSSGREPDRAARESTERSVARQSRGA